MELTLRCENCDKSKGFNKLEDAEKKGWVIVHGEHTFDTWLCPKCAEKRRSALGELEK